jgi:hypothetical protein
MRRTDRDIIENLCSSCKVPVFLVIFSQNLKFLTGVSKSTQISNFITIRPVAAKTFHADGHNEANSPFRNFANAPKNILCGRFKCSA